MWKKVVLGIAIVLAGLLVGEAQVTVPHTLVNPITLAQLNTNFSTVAAAALNRAGGTITGNIAVDPGVTIDGVDLSAAVGATADQTFDTLVLSNTGAGALDVAGGINAGSGNVGIVDTTGKIPALSSTYLANLSGAALTGLTSANLTTTWTSRAFSAGNYTANGAMTWTVASGDVVVDQYVEIGKVMFWSVSVLTTTISGTVNTELRITVPNSRTIATASQASGSCSSLDNAVHRPVTYDAVGGNTYVRFLSTFGQNWTLATDNTYITCLITLPFN